MASKKIDKNAIKQQVVDYLVNNQELIKERAGTFIAIRDELLKETPKELHGDIDKEYTEEVVSFICEMIGYDLAIDYETIYDILLSSNLNDYLKGE